MFRHVTVSLLGLILFVSPARAATTSVQGAQGLVVTVDDSGSYDISMTNPDWHFGGTIGRSLSNVTVATGLDSIGPYNEVGFNFMTTVARYAAIRVYANQTTVLFTINYLNGGTCFPFPSLSQYPTGLNHVAFSGTFTPPTFTTLADDSPWAFFDGNANTFILSPASHFMVSNLSKTSSGVIQSSLVWQVPSVPQGFSHQTLLVIDRGINRAFDTWGNALTALTGKVRPANDSDTSLKTLGYWTDNGASYYYRMENGLSYIDTLAAVKTSFDQSGIGLGYMQLDSWFYPKGPQAQWADSADGFYQYSADSDLFGSSLASFQQRIGVPLATHARWIDNSSPYRQQYSVSGNVSTDPSYWGMVAGYLKSAGVATYEQDWLSAQAQTAVNLTDPELFLGGMASAMAQAGLTMQYCMPTTHHVMQSSKYSNLTSIRGANDRFNPEKWTPFLYSSRLISSVGAWPFADVLMSSETSNLLLATLSAGPVGLGDKLGTLNPPNVLRAVRQDGVIVKPDAPITPVDATFQNDAASPGTSPMVASTHTDFGALQAHYLFAYPQSTNNAFSFKVSDLGWNGSAYVYDYFNGSGRVVLPTDVLNETISGTFMYLVVAPVGSSGIAVIGDAGQFVMLGRKRITSLTDDGSVHVGIAFAQGEMSRTLIGYSPWAAPAVTAVNGAAGTVTYDSASGRFSVAIQPGADGTASVRIDPAMRHGLPAPLHPPAPARPPAKR
jgi:hypothetical protein